MKTQLKTILTAFLLAAYGFAFVGCSGNAPPAATPTASTADSDHDDHDHSDHDHDHDHEGHDHDDHEGHDHDDHNHADDHDDSHAGHDHPAHGPNGGHMVELTGGAHAEWAHDDDEDLITVYAEDPSDVTKVEMKTTIEGEEMVYEFEKKEADGKTTFQLESPNLLTSIKMGKLVQTKLVITTADGEATGKVLHHAH